MKPNRIGLSIIAASLLTLPALAAAQSWLTAPSALAVGESIDLEGGGFAANAAVTLNVQLPDGSNDSQSLTTNENGSLMHSLAAPMAGEYQLTATPDADPQAAPSEVIVQVTQ